MKNVKFLLTAILIISCAFASVSANMQDQGKKKIRSSGAVAGEEEKEGKKTKVTFGKTGAVVGGGDEEVKAPPPPPPSLSRIAIVSVPDADVVVNSKHYRTDSKGVVRQAVDLRPGAATIIVRHPDYEEKTEKVVLKQGQSIVQRIDLISKYGEIKLGGIPEKAQVFIDGLDKTADVQREGEEITLVRVPKGVRKLKVTHPDYITREDELEVKPGEQLADAKGLALALADLTVHSLPGAEIYIDNEPRGKVLPDGSFVVTGIKPGERSIRIVKDGYVEKKLVEKLAVGIKEINVKIQPIPNSGEFFDAFNAGLNRWEAPAEWKVEGAKLVLRGSSQIGFPKGGNFRDLDGQFSVRMANGKGIAWTLHLQGNTKNYYLFYLCGPKGKFPGQFRTYICREGKFDLNNFQNSVPTSIVTITDKDIYTVRISVRGNKVETFIKPETGPEAGGEQPLDVFIDESNLFTYGNIGFTTIDGEETIIDDVGIKPVEKPEDKSEVKPLEKPLAQPFQQISQKCFWRTPIQLSGRW
jgi:hypothetical protein